MTFLLAHDQLSVYTILLHNAPHLDCLLHSHTTIAFTMCDGQRDRNLVRVVQGRNTFEKLADFRISLVAVLKTAVGASLRGSIG